VDGRGPDGGGDASHGAYDIEGLPRLALVEELRIGSLKDPDHGFSAVGGVDVDDEGRFYVFERQDLQIRVYSRDGVLLNRVGGRGDGPGEFRNPATFGVRSIRRNR
jgi:hypothetical protein